MIKLDKFKNRRWYRQGGLILPAYDGIPYKVIADIMGEGATINVYIGEKNYLYFDNDYFLKRANEHIELQLKDIKYIDKIYDRWKNTSNALLDAISIDITTVSHKHNKKSISQFCKLMYGFWEIGWNIEYFDPHGEDIIRRYIEIDEDDKAALFWPSEMSNVLKEKYELLGIVANGCSDSKIIAHQKKYYYLKCNWADGSPYTVEDIKNNIKELGELDVKREMNNIESHHKNI